MFDLYRALLDLDEDVERFSQGIKAVAAISQAHCYGEGLYAVCDYLYEVQGKMRRDLDRCLEQAVERRPGAAG